MRLRDRDAEFEPFYAAEAGRLRSLALLLTGDRDLAADLAQEALLRTYQSWPRIRTDPSAYTRRALINLYRNWVRRCILERRHRNTALALDERTWRKSPEDALRVADVCASCPPSAAPPCCCASTKTCPKRKSPMLTIGRRSRRDMDDRCR